MWWKIANWLARNWGWYTYDGLRGFHPKHWPVGHVAYKDGLHSVAMPLGNAWNYARSWGGTVIKKIPD